MHRFTQSCRDYFRPRARQCIPLGMLGALLCIVISFWVPWLSRDNGPTLYLYGQVFQGRVMHYGAVCSGSNTFYCLAWTCMQWGLGAAVAAPIVLMGSIRFARILQQYGQVQQWLLLVFPVLVVLTCTVGAMAYVWQCLEYDGYWTIGAGPWLALWAAGWMLGSIWNLFYSPMDPVVEEGQERLLQVQVQ